MSSRALRRLEKARELSTEPEPAPEPEHVPTRANAFALLHSDHSDDDDVDDAPVQPQPAPPTRQRKKKKAKKQAVRADSGSDSDLDRFLEEVRARDASTGASDAKAEPDLDDPEQVYDDQYPRVLYADGNFLYFTTSRLRQCLPLLSVGAVKNLDPDTELRNLFGNLSLDAIDDANTVTLATIEPEVLAQIKRMARLTRGWGGKDRRSVPGTPRKLLLTKIKDDWVPKQQRPLAMDDMRDDQAVLTLAYKEEQEDTAFLLRKLHNEAALGVRYFSFAKNRSANDYAANSAFYASVVVTADPDALMALLQLHPYHVETLLQLAMVFVRQGNDKAVSYALIERCLFAFDRSVGKRFHELLADGRLELIRLPYESFMNRQFYLCLFRWISGLGERSMYITALNYCKFLLSLSPAQDPLGVRYFIDHYAIMAEDYQYLINFVNSPLTQTYSVWFTPGLAFSKVLALLHLERRDEAKQALFHAFEVHPYCAYRLLETVGLGNLALVNVDRIAKDEFRELATETYLVRAGVLWKDQAHRQFLHDELMACFANKTEGTLWLGRLFRGSDKAKEVDIPVNLVRFAILSGESKLLAKVPEKIFERDDVFEYDVIPPKDDAQDYDVHSGVGGLQGVTTSMYDYLDHNILGAIIQNRSRTEFDGFEEPQ